MPSLAEVLTDGLQSLSLDLTDQQHTSLLDYIVLINKWNKVYNLTAVREPQQMLAQHVLDCLAALTPLKLRFAQPLTMLDVGAGGGLPSVVFAVACPAWRITAVDTVAKKAAFIQTTAHSLRLSNLRAVHGRVEELTGSFDVVTCRAFASLQDFCVSSRHLLAGDGRWVAMKARLTPQEMADLPPNVMVEQVQPLTVPGLDAERCLVWMRPV
ncbi:MAG: 16S rRNA (guanine(527)-N(7))-methyltransferase RsmG [Limnohabitans sp.]|nr:16S rRNA (guanine(527)-N(7))-methyltransferase RsmG [Limnohabitans sp.]